ncbi:MAG TPA: HEAT repeat domain-containing protein [Polyangia bacterium]
MKTPRSAGRPPWTKIGVAAGAALVVGLTLWVLGRPSDPQAPPGTDTETHLPSGSRGFLPNAPEPSLDHPAPSDGGTAQPEGPPPVATIMNTWRMAIINKDADPVVAIDQGFLAEPARFREALLDSAERDAEPRVRAFSTRVLGKFKDPTIAPTLTRLLGNESQYVRGNAAWALGELHHATGGRQAARPALKVLRRLERADPSPEVRAAAALAIKQLQ